MSKKIVLIVDIPKNVIPDLFKTDLENLCVDYGFPNSRIYETKEEEGK